ncbi:cytidylyltransferase domain-containing protein [Pedobacter sp. UC225_65]
MKVLAITQARVASTRLPRKILKTINGLPLLTIHLKRTLGVGTD